MRNEKEEEEGNEVKKEEMKKKKETDRFLKWENMNKLLNQCKIIKVYLCAIYDYVFCF